MKRIVFFLVGLVFVIFQINTVLAQGEGSGRHSDDDNEHCQRLHPSGTTHSDPIEADAMRWEAEWLDNRGSLSEATYSEIESQGHSREEVACYLEGARRDDGDRRHSGDRHRGR